MLGDVDAEPGDGQAVQQNVPELTDADVAELDHPAEDSGETPALAALKPGGVDLDHAGRAEGLKVAVERADEHERHEHPTDAGHGDQTESDVQGDGTQGAESHGLLPAEAVGKQPVEKLADGVSAVATGVDRAVLLVGEVEGLGEFRRRNSEVSAAEVVGGVHQPEEKPVSSSAQAVSGGMGRNRLRDRRGGGMGRGGDGGNGRGRRLLRRVGVCISQPGLLHSSASPVIRSFDRGGLPVVHVTSPMPSHCQVPHKILDPGAGD